MGNLFNKNNKTSCSSSSLSLPLLLPSAPNNLRTQQWILLVPLRKRRRKRRKPKRRKRRRPRRSPRRSPRRRPKRRRLLLKKRKPLPPRKPLPIRKSLPLLKQKKLTLQPSLLSLRPFPMSTSLHLLLPRNEHKKLNQNYSYD